MWNQQGLREGNREWDQRLWFTHLPLGRWARSSLMSRKICSALKQPHSWKESGAGCSLRSVSGPDGRLWWNVGRLGTLALVRKEIRAPLVNSTKRLGKNWYQLCINSSREHKRREHYPTCPMRPALSRYPNQTTILQEKRTIDQYSWWG